MSMSGEQLTGHQAKSIKSSSSKTFKNKVDINILLNKVRSEEKREKFESIIFISLISFVVLVTGIIISL